ncbi:TetR/AcrR family transcriptional regulator [Amorphus orientalis]|uniref:AcrR family transcriptional regulator n=1 Tax=Amorphus orientalis TaxID=649198 RepID=A0AAE3VLU3_9HYPH|nr:TetR family transcriptional regulator [Amorphus orientalis]MDQ0314423.1 AcrR family transcriptional regulator [Amorphus orientalis]
MTKTRTGRADDASDVREVGPAKEDGRLLRGEATRERVLDAAERLFADQGFDAVSIRQIAQEAGVTLGVVGFHGGAKLDLFRTILARRVEMLSSVRLKALDGIDARREPATLHELVDAYIGPYIEFAAEGDPQWNAYARLIARTVSDDRWYPQVRDFYDPVARRYIDAIARLYPSADRETIAAALVMSVACMLSVVASTARIAGLSQAEAADLPTGAPDVRAYKSVLIDFCAGGIERAITSA